LYCLFGSKKPAEAQGELSMLTPELKRLCDTVRETSLSIHRYHRHGHLEKIYQNALTHRLRRQGLMVEPRFPLNVLDEDGTPLGEFFADLFLEQKLILEVKACRTLADEHVAQLLGYLRSSRIEDGLLINFGAPKLQIRKYVLSRLDAPPSRPGDMESS